jgi:hydrogenase maturation protease
LFAERIEALAAQYPQWGEVACLTDFQLQVEHALDLKGRRRVLFVDASLDAAAPFSVSRVTPVRDTSFSSHAISPQAVLQVYRDLEAVDPPATWLLGIRGEGFQFGEPLSAGARANLEQALAWSASWLAGTQLA